MFSEPVEEIAPESFEEMSSEPEPEMSLEPEPEMSLEPEPFETIFHLKYVAQAGLTSRDLKNYLDYTFGDENYDVSIRHNRYYIQAPREVDLPEIDKYITEVAAEKAEDAWVAEQEAAVAAAARAAAAANTEANAEANMSCTIKSSIPCKLFRPDRLKTLLEELFPERGVRVEIHYNVYIIEAPRKVFLGRDPPDAVDGAPILTL